MYYLHLKFKNCGLISCINKPIHHLVRDGEGFGKHIKTKENKGHDLTNPIPYTLLSNVLHVLCGEIPAPTKKTTLLKRVKELDDIAKNSYIRYDYNVELNEKGYPVQAETFQTNKWFWNCGRNDVKKTFRLYDGTTRTVGGFLNWAYFRQSCNTEKDYNLVIDFISKFIGYKADDKTLDESVFYLSKFWNDKSFKDEVEKFMKVNKKSCNGSWAYVFFNVHCTTQNIYYAGRTPLFVNKGVSKITFIDGEIICPIDNDKIIDLIYHGTGHASLLEDGMVFVAGIENYEPYPDFKRVFSKIK